MNLVTLHFSSAVGCQFYTSYLEEMQTSLRGLRRAGGGGVTKDTPKKKCWKRFITEKRSRRVYIVDAYNIIIERMVMSS